MITVLWPLAILSVDWEWGHNLMKFWNINCRRIAHEPHLTSCEAATHSRSAVYTFHSTSDAHWGFFSCVKYLFSLVDGFLAWFCNPSIHTSSSVLLDIATDADDSTTLNLYKLTNSKWQTSNETVELRELRTMLNR